MRTSSRRPWQQPMDCAQHPGTSSGAGGRSAPDEQVIRRLRAIEGQVRGLQRMVEREDVCADVLVEVSSLQCALRGVAVALLDDHLHRCLSAEVSPDDAVVEARIAIDRVLRT